MLKAILPSSLRTAILALALVVFATFSSPSAQAQPNVSVDMNSTDTMSSLLCSKALHVMAMPVAFICVDSIFPIIIGGMATPTGRDGIGDPWNSTRGGIACFCNEIPGILVSMWIPDRMIEVVETPGCSPLTGINLGTALNVALSSVLPKGKDSTTSDGGGNSQSGFRHFNIWQSILPWFLGLPVASCAPWMPFETSLISPPWNANDPVIPNLLYPEWNLLYQSVIGFVQSTASCVNTTTGIRALQPIDDAMYWELGCWGKSLPANGRYADNDPVRASSLIAGRSLFHSARFFGNGFWQSAGGQSVCGPVPTPFPQKSAFKYSMMYPFTETGMFDPAGLASQAITSPLTSIEQLNPLSAVFGSCAHRLGESHWLWGMGKHKMTSPKDYIYMQWRWVDCCVL